MTDSFLDRSLEQRRQAVANLFDFLVGGRLADTTRTPSQVVDEGRARTLHRFEAVRGGRPKGPPVLLVPPLGSPAICFDLRRGCSVAEHLVAEGRRTYLVDYGKIKFSDKELGIEHWVTDVLPATIARVCEREHGRPVALVGWCMGGLMSILTEAAFPELPIDRVAMIASPFDFSVNPMLAPIRAIGRVTDGRIAGTVMRALGGIPAELVSLGFKATALPTYAKKPLTLLARRDDRDFLAHIEAVDGLMNNMHAYPGRATLQAYQRLIRDNELASGRVQGPTRVVDLADVRVPVLNVAGENDVLVSIEAAHHVGELVPNAPLVRLETAPGGHLGVLTGRSARATTWKILGGFLDRRVAAGQP